MFNVFNIYRILFLSICEIFLVWCILCKANFHCPSNAYFLAVQLRRVRTLSRLTVAGINVVVVLVAVAAIGSHNNAQCSLTL